MKRICPLLLLAALAGVAPAFAESATAHPPDPGELDEARARFQRGVDLYREGSLDAALAEFNKAYQLAPNYRVLYNIAQVQHERHDYVAALAAYQRYLDEGATDIPTERRDQVTRDLTTLKSRVAQVNVRVDVDGAELLIDSVVAATLPMKEPILVSSGVRQLQLRKSGYEMLTRTETIAGGEIVHLDLKLNPLPVSATKSSVVEKATDVASGPIVSAAIPDSALAAPRSSVPLWISLVSTGLFTGGAVTLGVLTHQSNQRFDQELLTFPGNRSHIDDARSVLKRDALLTDAFAAGAVISGGCFLYFAVTGSSSSSSKDKASKGLRVSPMGRGMQVTGAF